MKMKIMKGDLIYRRRRAGGTVGGERRIFNFFEPAPIKAFASL
jgi:hypothetical protein